MPLKGLPIDGRQDHEIKIKDFLNARVGNWKDWKLTKGSDIGKLHINLTLEDVEKLVSKVFTEDEDGIDEMEIDIKDTIVVEMQ